MTDRHEVQRRRLLFRSQRRGTKESDMVIGGFAENHLGDLDGTQLGQFEALLDQNDQDVLGWVIGLQSPPPEHDNEVLELLRRYKNNLQ